MPTGFIEEPSRPIEESMFEHFAVAIAAHTTVELTKAALEAAFRALSAKHPEIEAEAEAAARSGNGDDVDRVFERAIGVMVAEAKSGSLAVDGAVLQALEGIKFDHQSGEIVIGNTKVASKVLVTGGGKGATGVTSVLGNTEMKSQGTSIQVGEGARIVITGDASIKQT